MNRKELQILVTVGALTAGALLFLVRAERTLKLGPPGVKLVAAPLFTVDGKIARTNSAYLPNDIAGLTSSNLPLSEIELEVLPKDTTFGRKYYIDPSDGFQSSINVVLMGRDRTSIHKPQFCLTGQGWRIDKSEIVPVHIQVPHPYDLQVMKLTSTKIFKSAGQSAPYRGLYAYWFVSAERLTPSHSERMWWMAKDLLTTGVMPRWAYISYFAVCAPGQEDAAFARLSKFMAATIPQFQIPTGGGLAAAPRADRAPPGPPGGVN